MSRFYVPKSKIKKNEIIIDGKEARHVLDVMRLRRKDDVVVFDGEGNEYAGFIKETVNRPKELVVQITHVKKTANKSVLEITLAQAIPKMNRMDYIAEKATELGVTRVIPMVSERTVVRPRENACGKKTERWRKKAVAAAKQCGRRDIPVITDVEEYRDVVDKTDRYELILMACLSGNTVPLKEALDGIRASKILLFIGPEGGFSPEEIEVLTAKGNCRCVSLGARVLKSDTAGLYMLAVVGYELGD
ncbi:MAG: 16S rRNA (uracil(1498)-N(3))-methyltransferase [Candidatus Omnitrophota bacterium]